MNVLHSAVTSPDISSGISVDLRAVSRWWRECARLTTFLAFATLTWGYSAAASAPDDLKAFLAGQRTKYDSGGHPKAKGVHLTINYPTTWQAQEGERPNIVQKFTTKTPDGMTALCLLLIKDVPANVANEVASFNVDVMKDAITEMGAVYIKGAKTKIEGEDTVWVTYVLNAERAGMKMSVYTLQYTIFYKQKYIQFQCSLGGAQESAGIKATFDSYLPLFQAMANTIIFPDKWK